MDWNAAKLWPKGAGLVLAGIITASLLSFDLNDPTLTNLRVHSTGTGNWLGLPGALCGGSLVELFGGASLLVPVLVLNWIATDRGRPPVHRYAFWGVCLITALSAGHGLLRPPELPGLLESGLAGWAGHYWITRTTGPWAGGGILVFLSLFAANRLVFMPPVRAVFQGAGAPLLSGLVSAVRELWDYRRGLGRALAPPRPLGGAWSLPAALIDALAFWRRPSLAAIKARRPGPSGREALWREINPAPAGYAPSALPDQFDAWLSATALEPRQPVAPERDPAGLEAEEAMAPVRSHLDNLMAEAQEPDKSLPEAAPGWEEAGLEEFPEPRFEPEPEPVPEFEARTVPLPDPGEVEVSFEQPEAEAAWRERFQRYARNLDLDWEEQVWDSERGREGEEDGGPASLAEEPEG